MKHKQEIFKINRPSAEKIFIDQLEKYRKLDVSKGRLEMIHAESDIVDFNAWLKTMEWKYDFMAQIVEVSSQFTLYQIIKHENHKIAN